MKKIFKKEPILLKKSSILAAKMSKLPNNVEKEGGNH